MSPGPFHTFGYGKLQPLTPEIEAVLRAMPEPELSQFETKLREIAYSDKGKHFSPKTRQSMAQSVFHIQVFRRLNVTQVQ